MKVALENLMILRNSDKFAFNSNGIEHIGLNCGIFMNERGHFRD